MQKIQRVSTFFRITFQVIFVLLPLVFAYAWLQAPQAIEFLDHMLVITTVPADLPILHPLTGLTKFYGFLITMIPVSMVLLGLYFLIRLFRLYEQGIIFGVQNVHYIRNIGYALFASQLLNVVYDLLLSLALTWHNPPGQRLLAVSATGINLALLLTSLLVILISWIMAEAYKLQEEQQLTI